MRILLPTVALGVCNLFFCAPGASAAPVCEPNMTKHHVVPNHTLYTAATRLVEGCISKDLDACRAINVLWQLAGQPSLSEHDFKDIHRKQFHRGIVGVIRNMGVNLVCGPLANNRTDDPHSGYIMDVLASTDAAYGESRCATGFRILHDNLSAFANSPKIQDAYYVYNGISAAFSQLVPENGSYENLDGQRYAVNMWVRSDTGGRLFHARMQSERIDDFVISKSFMPPNKEPGSCWQERPRPQGTSWVRGAKK